MSIPVTEAQPATGSPADTRSLRITRVIRAPKERVFAAWTRPEMIRQWFAPGSMSVAMARTESKVGGEYRIEMSGTPDCSDPTPEQLKNPPAVQGVYREMVPYSLISFTWKGDWRPEEESLVTIRLSDADGGTLLELTQEGFLTDDSYKGHTSGWDSCLTKLSALLEA